MKSYCHHCKLETEGHPKPEDCITALLAEVARIRKDRDHFRTNWASQTRIAHELSAEVSRLREALEYLYLKFTEIGLTEDRETDEEARDHATGPAQGGRTTADVE